MTTDTKLADLPPLPATYAAGTFAPDVPVYDAGQMRAYAASALARQEAVAQDASSLVARLTNAAGLMLSEIDTCGHEVDPAYRLALYEAWEEGKSFPAAPPAQAVDLAYQVLGMLVTRGVIGRNGEAYKEARALIDQQAGKGVADA